MAAAPELIILAFAFCFVPHTAELRLAANGNDQAECGNVENGQREKESVAAQKKPVPEA